MSENIQKELDKLDQFNSPLAIIKKAFSSFGVILLIGGGVVFSWILSVVYLFGWASVVSTTWLLIGLLVLGFLFPGAYFFFAFLYGKSTLIWHAYQEAVKPIAASIVGSIFTRAFPNGQHTTPQEVETTVMEKEAEEEAQSLLDRLPSFISSKLELIKTIREIIHNIKIQHQSGLPPKQIKSKAIAHLFQALDTQLSGLVSEPSILPAGIILLVNVGFFVFLIS